MPEGVSSTPSTPSEAVNRAILRNYERIIADNIWTEPKLIRKSPPKTNSKFWRINLLGDKEENFRYRPQDKVPEVYIGNEHEGGIVVKANIGYRGTTVYTIHNQGTHVTPMAKVCPYSGVALVGDDYDREVGDGRPNAVSRDAIRLLKEAKEFVDGCGDASKKQRWMNVLKPSIEAMLEMSTMTGQPVPQSVVTAMPSLTDPTYNEDDDEEDNTDD